jgi:hypothetical protein
VFVLSGIGTDAERPYALPPAADATASRSYEQAIGHPTSNSTIYNLLARHGWRKLMPRPFHPKRDIAAQEAFKKNGFPNAVKQVRRVAARRGCGLRALLEAKTETPIQAAAQGQKSRRSTPRKRSSERLRTPFHHGG